MDKLWSIHGNAYDLNAFLEHHPGGKDILLSARGVDDATPLFESYHAFANRSYILNKLEEYRVDVKDEVLVVKQLYSFKPDGFYKTLVGRVRDHFGAQGQYNKSVTAKVKATAQWWATVSTQMGFLALFAALAFHQPLTTELSKVSTNSLAWVFNVDVPMAGWLWESVAAFFTGVVFIQVGFTVMHDASHFAIKSTNSWMNDAFARTWNALSLWKFELWMTHHVVRHHSFTGDVSRDPDIQHAKPLIRKHPSSPRHKYLSDAFMVTFGERMSRMWCSVWVFLVYTMLPGMWLGQIAAYWLIWSTKEYLWGMTIPESGTYSRRWYEPLLNLLVVAIHVHRQSLYVTGGFVFGCNVAYSMCILPDHDTLDTMVAAEQVPESSRDEDGLVDWGEVQVRHSANFSNGSWGDAFARLYGGINYQIEHHLFPGMSHVHYPAVSSIVKDTCEEFGIEYTAFGSLAEALGNFVDNVFQQMTPQQHADCKVR